MKRFTVVLVLGMIVAVALAAPALAAGRDVPVGAPAQPAGTTVAIGYDYADQCDVAGWTGIAQVAGGASYTVGVFAMTPTARAEVLADFLADPTVGSVDPSLRSSLTATLDDALTALHRGKSNDARVAVNVLEALVAQVEAQAGKKISHEAATSIVLQVDAIIAAIGR